MDPNAALARIIAVVDRMREHIDNDEVDIEADDYEAQAAEYNKANAEDYADIMSELVDLWDGLHSWMSRGGFLPTEWAKGRATSVKKATKKEEG